jgi:hypothetical protein
MPRPHVVLVQPFSFNNEVVTMFSSTLECTKYNKEDFDALTLQNYLHLGEFNSNLQN